MKWKIWYDDGSTCDSENWHPDGVPVDGVQSILQWLSHGNYEIIPPADYYWWLDDRWASGNVAGLDRMLRKRPCLVPIVLFGRWSSGGLYDSIQAEVHLEASSGGRQ